MEAVSISDAGEIRVSVECMIICGTKVLMQKRSMDMKYNPGAWIIPGGHVDLGEDFLTAVIREVKEETNIDLSDNQVKLKVSALNFHEDKKRTWNAMAFYAEIDETDFNSFENEEGSFEWIEKEELLKQRHLVFPPIELYLDHILDGTDKIMFMSSIWENLKLVKLTSQKIT